MDGGKLAEYWRKNLALIRNLLVIWAVVAYGLGILLAPALNSIRVFGGPPLGFWIAQQGAIWVFIVLIFVYAARMQALDRAYGFED
jgi:putative solute:sodium symporter small subunit